MTDNEKNDDKSKKIAMLSNIASSLRSQHPEFEFLFLTRDITTDGRVYGESHLKNVTTTTMFIQEAKNINTTLINQQYLKQVVAQQLSSFVVVCIYDKDQDDIHTKVQRGSFYSVSGIRVVGKEVYYDITELPNTHLNQRKYKGYNAKNFIRFVHSCKN